MSRPVAEARLAVVHCSPLPAPRSALPPSWAPARPRPPPPQVPLASRTTCAERSSSPGTKTAAGFRWWWPHGLVDPDLVARQVDEVATAGFGVLEIADVTHSLRARNIEIDVASHGWGTPAWVSGVKAALDRAAKGTSRIDVTVGPSWPAAVPTITPDDEPPPRSGARSGGRGRQVRRTTVRCRIRSWTRCRRCESLGAGHRAGPPRGGPDRVAHHARPGVVRRPR